MAVYDVQPTTQALKGLLPVERPAERDKRLPPPYLFVYGVHPLTPTSRLDHVGNVYIIFIDPSPEGKRKWVALQEAIKIPYARDEDLEDAEPGMFSRCTISHAHHEIIRSQAFASFSLAIFYLPGYTMGMAMPQTTYS